ncbi:MAG: Glucose-6-phosphate isomerase [Moraxellaceae bacterium]|jgi:glucose-6-phosphate isomerase|nr:Glucose-6-phosphate isomerase [Moraxellaceae bacterium]
MSQRSTLPAWQRLQQLADQARARHLRDGWQSDRAARFARIAGPLHMDFSKQRIVAEDLEALLALARECGLEAAVRALMQGEAVNNTEGRPALHSALRARRDEDIHVAGRNVVADVYASLARMESVVSRIHSRQWRGYSGKAISDVVNIGVGGSDLGPYMACNALGEFTAAAASGLRLHFASSIDGTQIADLLGELKPETTLFIVSSKSFTTLDTLSNARTALQWMLSETGDADLMLRHHFIGVSARPDRMTEWGIPPCNQIEFWEWVGGRFSLWSGIGLPIALMLGMDGFRDFLAGAQFMDEHFRTAPLADNLPVLLGLIGVWNATFLDIRAHAVLPYDGRLKFFPAYLTQLEMESNGKSVSRSGETLDYSTCPVLWGDVGPNAQHAFYQLLHQGTQAVSSDFIAPIRRYAQQGSGLQLQHQLALANCLAQSRVLMLGDACVENGESAPEFRRYRGNQPSTTLLLDELNPFALGALVALYEHKVFVMSVIWDINPFDQWGVELGKQIADATYIALKSGDSGKFDASTEALLQRIRTAGKGDA